MKYHPNSLSFKREEQEALTPAEIASMREQLLKTDQSLVELRHVMEDLLSARNKLAKAIEGIEDAEMSKTD